MRAGWTQRRRLGVTLFVGTTFQLLGFIDSCDDRLLAISRYVDPCGTLIGNCFPGDLETNAAEVGDFCVDPACTVPGQCGGGQALGTITDVCP